MYKKLLSVMAYGLLIVACSGPEISAPTVTAIPPTPTVIPSPTRAPISLLAERDLETQTGTSYSLEWSSDGEMLAVASGVEITLLRSDLEEIIAVLKPSSGALTATWSPDGKRFATVAGFRNPTVTLWDWDDVNAQLTMAKQIQAGSDQYGVAWSPDGKLLASLAGDRKSVIQIWDTETWELLHEYDLPYTNPRRALIWSADSKTIHDAGELGGQAVYFALNVEDGTVQELGELPIEQVYAFIIAPDAKSVAVADEAGLVRLFTVGSGDLMAEFQAVDTPVDLAWNPDGRTLAILGYKTDLQLWEITP